MQLFSRRSLSLTGAAALALAAIPQVNAKPVEMAQGSADDLGVMSINLKDIVKPQVGFQGQTQAAGTPNQARLPYKRHAPALINVRTTTAKTS